MNMLFALSMVKDVDGENGLCTRNPLITKILLTKDPRAVFTCVECLDK